MAKVHRSISEGDIEHHPSTTQETIDRFSGLVGPWRMLVSAGIVAFLCFFVREQMISTQEQFHYIIKEERDMQNSLRLRGIEHGDKATAELREMNGIFREQVKEQRAYHQEVISLWKEINKNASKMP